MVLFSFDNVSKKDVHNVYCTIFSHLFKISESITKNLSDVMKTHREVTPPRETTHPHSFAFLVNREPS